MFILDTNVISELMRPQPDPAVFAWVAAQPRDTLFTTSVSEAEVFHGIGAMPEGRRRDGLAASAEALFVEEFAGRVLPFAGIAARRYGEIITGRLTVGKPISSFDALIADFDLHDAALDELAKIVRGADTGNPDLTPQSHGLLAVSLGLSALYRDDHEMLKHGMLIYDALYAWLKTARAEIHNADLFKKS